MNIDMRIYNACRNHTLLKSETCGVAIKSEMWTRTKCQCRFTCMVNWEKLKEATRKVVPHNPDMRQWVDALNQSYGENWPALKGMKRNEKEKTGTRMDRQRTVAKV